MESKLESEPVGNVSGFGPGTVADRIRARVVVLEEWVARKTITPGEVAPRSLTGARKWSAPEIGIFPIYSPNDFTKSHPKFGAGVTRISELLAELSELVDRKDETNRSLEGPDEDLASVLQRVVSQWHIAREECNGQRSKAEAAEAHLKTTRDKLKEQIAGPDALRQEAGVAGGVVLALSSRRGD